MWRGRADGVWQSARTKSLLDALWKYRIQQEEALSERPSMGLTQSTSHITAFSCNQIYFFYRLGLEAEYARQVHNLCFT